MFKGSMVALVTPMQTNGAIDKKSLCQLIEWHIFSKTRALIIAGSTGESPTLTMGEQFELLTTAVNQAAGRIPIIAGTGSNSTQHAIEMTLNAKKAGAAAALMISPYYNKPTQNGLYEHYKLIADKVGLPIILYNAPGRTANDILPETVERLAKIPNIIGIKEATHKIERATYIIDRCGPHFSVYSGEDSCNLGFMLNGAAGVISVTANVVPNKMHTFCEAIFNRQLDLAAKIHTELMPLHETLFLETNPIPVKWALLQMQRIPAGIRLPLLPLDAAYHTELRNALTKTGAFEIN